MTQPWSLEPADVRDGMFAVKCLEDVGRRILAKLASRPGEVFATDDLEREFRAELDASRRRSVLEHIWLANEVAVSYDRDPLVDVRDAQCTVTESGALIIAPALGLLSEAQDEQRRLREQGQPRSGSS